MNGKYVLINPYLMLHQCGDEWNKYKYNKRENLLNDNVWLFMVANQQLIIELFVKRFICTVNLTASSESNDPAQK